MVEDKVRKYAAVAERIKRKMKERGLRHKHLVEACAVTGGTVSHWMNGDALPTGKRLAKLCLLLDVKSADLLQGANYDSIQNDFFNNNNLIESGDTAAIPYFRSIKNCIFYIKNTNTEGYRMEHLHVPIAIINSHGVDKAKVLILKDSMVTSKVSARVDMFLDQSIKLAKETGRYLIEIGEFIGVRELSVHPINRDIEIIDLDGNGSDTKTPISNFNQELIIHAKAFYAGISLV